MVLSDPVKAVGPFTFETNSPRYRVKLDPLAAVVVREDWAPLDLEIAVYGPPEAAASLSSRIAGWTKSTLT